MSFSLYNVDNHTIIYTINVSSILDRKYEKKWKSCYFSLIMKKTYPLIKKINNSLRGRNKTWIKGDLIQL